MAPAPVSAEARTPQVRVPRPVAVAIGAAVGMFAVAGVLNVLWPVEWPLAILAGAGVVALGWRRGWGRLRLVLFGAGWAWLAAAWALSPRPELLLVLAVGTVAAGIVWAVLDRRRGGHVLRLVRREWPVIAEAAGLPGSRISGLKSDETGWRGRLELRPGRTVAEATARIDNLESALNRVAKVRPGAVHVSKYPDRANVCQLRVVMRDPLAVPVEWPGPAIDSIKEPVPLGPDLEGEIAALSLAPSPGQAVMALIAGPNGSGKSELLNVIVGNVAHCRDAVLWGADFKRTEFTPWQECFDLLATSTDEAVAMLEAALRVIEARSVLLAREGLKSWRPTPERPELIIAIDEFADLAGRMDLVHAVIRKGRAVGVQLVIATQRPTATALGEGGTDVRAEIKAYVCMRVERPEESDYVLGRGRSAEGWRADRLGEPGSFLLLSPRHRVPRPARCYLVGERVEGWARLCAPLRPRLDRPSANAVSGLVDDRP